MYRKGRALLYNFSSSFIQYSITGADPGIIFLLGGGGTQKIKIVRPCTLRSRIPKSHIELHTSMRSPLYTARVQYRARFRALDGSSRGFLCSLVLS